MPPAPIHPVSLAIRAVKSTHPGEVDLRDFFFQFGPYCLFNSENSSSDIKFASLAPHRAQNYHIQTRGISRARGARKARHQRGTPGGRRTKRRNTEGGGPGHLPRHRSAAIALAITALPLGINGSRIKEAARDQIEKKNRF